MGQGEGGSLMAGSDPTLRFRPNDNRSDIEGPLSALLDLVFGTDQGTMFFRGEVDWIPLVPGLAGQVLHCSGPDGPLYWDDAGTGYAAPAFSSFAITGQTTPIEVGATIAAGSKTFTWATTNNSNITANSISIVDTTASVTLASGLANDGSQVISIGAITNTIPATQVWTINGVNTHLATFSRTYSVIWEWRVYAGTNSAGTLTSSQIKALSDSNALQASFPGTYNITSSPVVYYYFSYPDSMGSVSFFVDGNTGFPISMAEASDNPAYSNTANGWSYAIVSVTNAQGVTTDYRVYRTQFNFSGTLKMVVS